MTVRVGLLRHDGKSPVPFELSIVDLIEDPTVEGFVISAHDASAQVAAEHELSDALSLLTATLDSTADGILVVDNDGAITGFNRRFSEIWRIAADFVAVGDDSSKLAFVLDQLLNPQTFLARRRELQHKPENESFDTLEFKDGRAVELSSRPQAVGGRIVGRVWSFRDVTDRIRLEDELEYRAFHDSLTGLANKALFQDRLEHALARIGQTGSHLAVLFIDLDDFKTVNDSLGHGEGDQLLKGVATSLSKCLRPLDTAARIGGDEFAILIEDVWSREDITDPGRTDPRIAGPAVPDGTRSASSAGSIGIAFDEPGITSEQLLRNADIAMYKAKESGKNRFEVYREEMHAAVLARIEQERELRAAIHDGDLLTHYQPIYDLDTRRIIGFEALVRWAHPIGGLVDPRLFVPLAEELGLIGEIDSFVLRSACMQARQWQRAGPLGPGPGHERQPVTGPTHRSRPGPTDRRAGRGVPVRSPVADPRDHRERDAGRQRDHGAQPGRAAIPRGAHRARRLRDGVLLALPPRPAAGRHREDRQVLRPDPGVRRRHAQPGCRHGAAGPHARLRDDRRGRGEPGARAGLRALGCRFAQGYHLGRPLNIECTDLLLKAQDRARPGRRNPDEGLSRRIAVVRGRPLEHPSTRSRISGFEVIAAGVALEGWLVRPSRPTAGTPAVVTRCIRRRWSP